MSCIEDAPEWAVEYVKMRRRLYGSKRPRPLGSKMIKRYIATMKEAQNIFRKVERSLPQRTDGKGNRSEQTIEDFKLTAKALATLLTDGRIIDTEIASTVFYLASLYDTKTGRPHYPDVGLIVTMIFSDVLATPEDVAGWARKTATRYGRYIEQLGNDRTFDRTIERIGKSTLLKDLRA